MLLIMAPCCRLVARWWTQNSGRSPRDKATDDVNRTLFSSNKAGTNARGPVFTLFDFAFLIDSPSGQAREGGISGSPSTPASRFPKTNRSGRTRASRRVAQTTWPARDPEMPTASSQRGGWARLVKVR
jgi:hypothetical protein